MRKFIIFFLALFLPASLIASGITDDQQARLINLLKHDCGSCHGLTLKGGLGPALTSDRLSGLPRELIVHTITNGRDGTPMPPWKALLSKNEIEWLVDYLYAGEKSD